MAADERDQGEGGAPFLQGSFIWNRYGPLPAWAWMGLALGALLAYTIWRRNRQTSGPNPDPSAVQVEDVGMRIGGNQTAPFVFAADLGPINLHNQAPPVHVTVPAVPPGGGRPTPPQAPPAQPTPTPPPVLTWVLPKSMTVKEASKAIYGDATWNGPAGRLYYRNEAPIVNAARASGRNTAFADFKLPAGFTLVRPY